MKSVATTIRVFEAVAAAQPIGLSELSRRLEVPKASVQRALAALAAAGWLRQDVAEPGRWVVSARFALLADAAPDVVAVREAARPHLDALRESTGFGVGLLVLDGDHMVLVAGPPEASMLKAVEESLGPLPVHVSAAGRAILSRLPLATRTELLDRALRRYTPNSLTAPEAVLAEVERAEQVGYAVIRGEYQPDVSVVAAPILQHGVPVAAAALFVSDAEVRESELGATVVACAAAIGAELGVPGLPAATG